MQKKMAFWEFNFIVHFAVIDTHRHTCIKESCWLLMELKSFKSGNIAISDTRVASEMCFGRFSVYYYQGLMK